jgi:hypothetical protein
VSWVGRLSILGAGRPPGEIALGRVLREARLERTLPIVCRNLGLACPEERQILARQVQAAHQAREIGGRVEVLPLKGLHLAHRVYPSPGLRDMGDIDLLVRRGELPGADRALRALGYAPQLDPFRLAGGGGSLQAALYLREDSLPVHLHWHPSNASLPHFMYRIDADEVWSEARGGAMAPHHFLVALCEHALKHSYAHLVLLSDIELASRGADWGLVRRTAERWGLTSAVRWALALIRSLMGVRSPGLGSFPGREGRAFLAAARLRRWDGLSALGFLSMAQGVRQKARFVREALAPGSVAGLASAGWARRFGRAAGMVWSGLTS